MSEKGRDGKQAEIWIELKDPTNQEEPVVKYGAGLMLKDSADIKKIEACIKESHNNGSSEGCRQYVHSIIDLLFDNTFWADDMDKEE